ncbi:MAG TPA: hypothetical protein LFW13_00540 [Rickettsia endosymbiont of Sericostoma sp.]|uniref:hypothetical protein n=1 Tax=Candidatus Tisiphia endosymbiont of Mystacides longicornis TaxID=3139330 RepID=UPI001D35DE12|nr:hypothetical protein [Rickettsia endosymbiont of Sericostoma sp.]
MSKDYIDNKAHLGENKEKLLLNYKDISLYALVPEIPLIISHGCVKSVIMKFMGLNDVNINYGEIVSFRFSEHKWSVNSIDEYELTGNTNDFN